MSCIFMSAIYRQMPQIGIRFQSTNQQLPGFLYCVHSFNTAATLQISTNFTINSHTWIQQAFWRSFFIWLLYFSFKSLLDFFIPTFLIFELIIQFVEICLSPQCEYASTVNTLQYRSERALYTVRTHYMVTHKEWK